MHAPLARHLARFSRVPPAGASADPVVANVVDTEVLRETAEPSVTMTVAAFEMRLEATRDELRAALQAEHAAQAAEVDAAHAAALASAVAAAAARRDAEEGAALAVQITAAVDALRDALSRQAAKALQAILAEAVAARAVAALIETVERVLADPDHPMLTIRGPAPLLAAIEAAPGMAAVTFEIIDTDEITVTAEGIRIETRLAAALAALAATEGA